MSRRKHVAQAGAALAAVGGLAMAASPTTGGDLGTVGAVLGVTFVGLGTILLVNWLRTSRSSVSLPPVGTASGLARPGADLDRRLAAIPAVAHSGARRQSAGLQADLQTVAVDVLREYRGLSPEAAEEALKTGRWTDDPLASAFFRPGPAGEGSIAESLAGSVTGRGPFHRRADRAVRELEAIATAAADHEAGDGDGAADAARREADEARVSTAELPNESGDAAHVSTEARSE